MSKKSHFRGHIENQHGKRARALFKPASLHLYHIYRSLSRQLSWKKSLLLTCQILGLLVNTLDSDFRYPILNRETLTRSILMQLPQKENNLSQFWTEFLKSRLNFEHFEKKVDPHSFCISDTTNSENVLRKMPKKYRFRGPFDKEHGKGAQALFKSASHHFYQILWSLPSKWSWEKFLLMTCKILALLLNTLAADEKYLVLHRDNLTIPIQMQSSDKEKNFSQFFAGFLKSIWNLERFESKDDPHSFCISDTTHSEKVVR